MCSPTITKNICQKIIFIEFNVRPIICAYDLFVSLMRYAIIDEISCWSVFLRNFLSFMSEKKFIFGYFNWLITSKNIICFLR